MVLPPGHFQEIASKRAFTRRERRTLAVVMAGLVAFAVVLIIALTGPSQNTVRGCVDVSIVGATGAAAIHQCGANARALCRSTTAPAAAVNETGRAIRAACRRDGFPVG
jgi:hypothetical protein